MALWVVLLHSHYKGDCLWGMGGMVLDVHGGGGHFLGGLAYLFRVISLIILLNGLPQRGGILSAKCPKPGQCSRDRRYC